MKIKNEKYIMPKTCIFANNIVGYIFVTNIVTDFTTSAYGSSCNYVSPFRSYYLFNVVLGLQSCLWILKNRKRNKRAIIRLTSDNYMN